MRRRWAATVVILLVLAACGGSGTRQVKVYEEGRYCDLAMQFESAAVATGAASAPGRYDGPPEATARLLDQVGPTAEEFRATAPDDLRDDVNTVLEELREARNGDTSGIRSPAFAAASDRMTRFRQTNCEATGAGGEGDL